jgi:hypothetical protein
MRNRRTARLATLALVTLVGSGIAAVGGSVAEAGDKDPPHKDSPYYRHGVSDVQLVREARENVRNFDPVTAYCPDGKKVLGGGGQVTGTNPILTSTVPASDGSAWIAAGRSSTASAVNVVAWAICAKVS